MEDYLNMAARELRKTIWDKATALAERDEKSVALEVRARELEDKLELEVSPKLRDSLREYVLVGRQREAVMLQHSIDVLTTLLIDLYAWTKTPD